MPSGSRMDSHWRERDWYWRWYAPCGHKGRGGWHTPDRAADAALRHLQDYCPTARRWRANVKVMADRAF